MKTAAVSELKARLSEFLGLVKSERDRDHRPGRPVARLVPVGRISRSGRNPSL